VSDAGWPVGLLWSSTKGLVRLTKAAPGVLVFTYEGDIDDSCVEAVIAALERAIESEGGRVRQFLDFDRVSSYSSDFRVRLAAWYQTNLPRLGEVHIWAPPDKHFVSMAATLFALSLGGACHVAQNRPAFDRALRAARDAPLKRRASSQRAFQMSQPAPAPLEIEPYAETPLVKLYWLPSVSAGYGVLSGPPTLSLMREALARADALLVDRRSSRWVTSTENLVIAPPEVEAYIAAWLRAMRDRQGLRAWADVPPHSAVARLLVKRLGAEASAYGLNFAQFPSLAEAVAWVGAQ
jgi:hypothetical protein